MEVLNKLLPLIMALVMSVNLSGCGNRAGAESGQLVETTAAAVQTETTEKKELKRVTVEELVENIYIDGVHIPFPCTYNELCDCFGSENINESNVSGLPFDGTEYFNFVYRVSLDSLHDSEVKEDFYCGALGFSIIAQNHDEIYDCPISEINYYPGKEHFEICGLDENSKYDDMVNVLGNGYLVNDILDEYEYESNNIKIIIGIGQFNHINNDDSDRNKFSHIRLKFEE